MESGFCQCGCGQRTSLAQQTVAKLGHVKGQPVFYMRGHANRKREKYAEEDRGYGTPCWIWQLWQTDENYGRITLQRVDGGVSSQLAHRWVWEQKRGPIPHSLQLDHLCEQPACVNPDHLEPVTNAENVRRSRTTKLTWDDVRIIRAELAAGATHAELATRYRVCIATIGHIKSGRNWRE